MNLEVIATDLDDAGIISNSNADRIEFCSHMDKGGLTPHRITVIKALRMKHQKPIKVMIRPTDKTFNYSFFEYLKMYWQVIRFCHVKKVQGLVFGILTKDNEIDINRMGRLIRICKKHRKTVTFHMAVDEVPNYEIAFNTLHELGVETVLTKGGSKPAIDNLKELARLKGLNHLDLLVGGGVDLQNVKVISKVADEIHVGSSIRIDHDWKKHIDLEMINRIKEKIK